MIKDIILKATTYSGNHKPNRNEISASELGNDVLQIYLRNKFGVQETTEFDQAGFGSLIHLAMEKIFENTDPFKAEENYEWEIVKDWKLTGTIDLYDYQNQVIYDYKVIKKYTIDKLLKEPNHQYVWQLNAYRYLVEHDRLLEEGSVDMKILAFIKDAGFNIKTGVMESTLQEIPIRHIDNKLIEERFKKIIEEIKIHRKSDTYPPQCKDLWFRKIKGEPVPMRCKVYCSYNEFCPYYKNKSILF